VQKTLWSHILDTPYIICTGYDKTKKHTTHDSEEEEEKEGLGFISAAWATYSSYIVNTLNYVTKLSH
jgi:hypothetical protein